MTEKRTMTQRALEVYDLEGEAALLDFLIVHRGKYPERENAVACWKAGLHAFEDYSLVAIRSDLESGGILYAFSWDGGCEIRPASNLASTMPLPPEPDAPMLPWPGVESIVDAMIHRIERQTREELGLEDSSTSGSDPILNRYQRLVLAPDIYERAGEFVQKVYEMPDSILSILDEEQEHCAEMTLESLPEEQKAALYAAVAERVRAGEDR